MTGYIASIKILFDKNANIENAFSMKKYMKGKFNFYGIKSPLRKELCKPFLNKENRPPIDEIVEIIINLWNEPKRELQYFALELLIKYSKQLKAEDYSIFEIMITNKSWWDTVDLIASNLVGTHFNIFSEIKKPISEKLINSDNMWLNRTAIIFQLKYKETTHEEMLYSYILQHAGSLEFFIRKAIGWSLREYAKTNPESVMHFVKTNENKLSGLSIREALKHIK